ncbi:hypothetical protein ACLEPN_39720 [Myxococcus sp. 1LA]
MCILTTLMLGCSSSATGTASRRDMGRRDAYALASCTDTVSCCVQRNPGVPEACGLTAAEAAAYVGTMDAAMKRANEKAEEEDDAEGWKEECKETYVQCRDEKNPVWEGDCYACFRYCEGQHEWPADMCKPRKNKKRR